MCDNALIDITKAVYSGDLLTAGRIVVRLAEGGRRGPVRCCLAAELAALRVLAARPLLADEQRRMVAVRFRRVLLLAHCTATDE